MFYSFRKILHPENYQGKAKKKNYFEGWFFKIVDHSLENVLAIIPGIFRGNEPDQSHAFLQVLNGYTLQWHYHRFPLSEFHASENRLEIQIGPNLFSWNKMVLNLKTNGQTISGELNFSNLNPWPVSLTSPGTMGWYAFVPFMECYHGVLSFDHTLNGDLEIDGKQINFSSGRGYIEKDWGKSFPEAYVWIQSNHFKKEGLSLMVSVAKIPWLKGSFRGFLIGLLWDGKLIRFTTYNGSQLNFLKISEQTVELETQNKDYLLRISAIRKTGGKIYAPSKNQMQQRLSETLVSEVSFELFRLKEKNRQPILAEKGIIAGLDVYGKNSKITEADVL
jgi:tocopherol cyclase